MLLIEKRRLFVIIGMSFLMILAAAMYAYNIGMQANEKSSAETILFVGFIIAAAHLLLSIGLFVHAYKRKKDLAKFTELVRMGGNISEKKIARFGSLGTQIKTMLQNLNDISNKKSLRIAALNGLQKSLLDLISEQIFIVDLTGTIIDMSKTLKEKSGTYPISLTDLLPSADIKIIFQNAQRTHAPIIDDDNTVFFPIFSTLGDITFFIVDISKQSSINWASLLTKKQSVQKPVNTSETHTTPSRKKFWKKFLKK